MTFDIPTTLTAITSLISTSRDIIIIILVIYGFRSITQEIKSSAKEIPHWLEKYRNIQMEIRGVDKAIELREKLK